MNDNVERPDEDPTADGLPDPAYDNEFDQIPDDAAASDELEQDVVEPDAAPPTEPPSSANYQAATPVSPLSIVFFLGLAFLLVGLIWWQVEQDTTPALVIWLFASLVAVLSPLAWHAVDLFGSLGSRRTVAFFYVLLTLTLGTVGLVAVSAVNFTLHERGALPSADMTENNEFSLGEETRNLFAGIDGTVYFTYVENRSHPVLRRKAYDQLRLYSFQFGNVELQSVNPLRHPSSSRRRMADWGIIEPPTGEDQDVIIVTYSASGKEIERGRTKELELNQTSWITSSALGENAWMGERLISSAVRELVFDRKVAYVTGGHSEDPFGQTFRKFRERITSQNIDLRDGALNLSQNPVIPDDCSVLFVMNPKSSFDPSESDAIGRWLDEKGGTLFVCTDVVQNDDKLGLERLLAEYGLEPRRQFMVMAPDIRGVERGGMILNGFRPRFPVTKQQYTDHPAVKALRAGVGRVTVFFETSFITVSDRPTSIGAIARSVVKAPYPRPSPGSNVDARSWGLRMEPGRAVPPAPDTSRDVTGSELTIVATSERDAAKSSKARVVLVGDTDCFADKVLQSGREPNLDLAVGLVQWGLEREGLISISNATMDDIGKQMTPRLSRVAFWWTLGTALLPLIFGGAVWWYRRR